MLQDNDDDWNEAVHGFCSTSETITPKNSSLRTGVFYYK